MSAVPDKLHAAVDPRAARQAAQWLVRLHAGDMSEADRQACAAWRAAHPDHELAWQRAELVSRKFGMVPAQIGLPALRKAAKANRRAAVKTLVLLMTAGPVAWGVYRVAPWQQWTSDHHTATGERRTLTLADGTRLTMNTATAVDVAYDDRMRLIRLRRGEILIDTAKDPAPLARPFVVESAQGRMRALGTRFVVRQNEDNSRIAVSEGAVEVVPHHNAAAAFVVPAGHQADFTDRAGMLADIEPHVQSWADGVLYAEKMPLDVFVREVARYRSGVLRCDPALAELRVSGAFQLDDTDAIIKALVASLPIRATLVTRYWVTLGPI